MIFSATQSLGLLALSIGPLATAAGNPHAQIQHETTLDFDCYTQSAETRMDARKTFLLAESDANRNNQLVHGGRILTLAPDGINPHKIAGGQIYDWIGSVFIPRIRLDRLKSMLEDYDHRAPYFPETIATSKLLCRTGKDHFRYTMRLKEPAIFDVESDVTWEQEDPRHWRCRSYSTKVQEVGKDHGYLRRLNSYWRFAETAEGVYVEGETITLSDEFSSMARAFGSALLGINPEKSLRHSLQSMRESILKPGSQIANPQEALPECAESFQPGPCASGR
jgi:hypothetical protein